MLEDIEKCSSKFSFTKDEILGHLQEVWPKLRAYITDISEECDTLEKELLDEKSDNHQLQEEIDNLLNPNLKHNKSSSFRNKVLKHEERPHHWLLHMWNILEGWHTNPMSIPNAVRDDYKGYFLEEDIDITNWLSKVPAPVKLPTGAEFLTLILKHCSLSREQICTQIIPYMERDGEKWPYSTAGSECAAYMQIHQHAPAPNKGKKPLTGLIQSKPSAHTPQPAKARESSRRRLDVDLDTYNQSCEPTLPYDEEPPHGVSDVEMSTPVNTGTRRTLPDESAMSLDHEIDDLSN
ncbi:hypothetical protein M422DRAFT_259746 [Sphaerobolus stellatus SS14]|uniref:Uncharacterized protein n=1 Tax=Sphaerobolus stellatus (strain SS14) TaxID=990650 RepID=A0A0C9U3Z1_SPHS4|nr:hypothetical protein M422DRAFT_259746 [Sphaerobolus stellatus SS14]